MNDLRFAIRQLLKNRGFTAVATVTLALGIGATTAIFSVVNGVVLRPLPYPQSERLVWLAERGLDWSGGALSYPNFVDWRAGQDCFEHFGVYSWTNFTLTGAGDPLRLECVLASADVFAALKTPPKVGRYLSPADDKAGAEPVVLLSHALWQGRFAADAAVVGRPVTLDGRPHTVIGVMPAGFAFPNAVDCWAPVGPFAANPTWQERGNHPGLLGVARLKPGVSVDHARAALGAVSGRLAEQYPVSNRNRGAQVEPLLDHEVGEVARALWTLLVAVALVLFIACANVANLLLARAAARQKELAVRGALGASRWRIVRQLLTESIMLAAVGAAGGLLLANWGLRLILALGRDSIPRSAEVGLDGRVLLFSAGLALITGVLFGLAPALHAAGRDAYAGLKEAGRAIAGGRGRLRQVLTAAEVALTLVLLVGAGLLLRSFYHLTRVNPGFAYERVLTFRTSLPEQKYPSPVEQARFYRDLLAGVRAIPGVQSASLASQLPLDGNSWDTTFIVDGRPEPAPHERPSMEVHLVGPDYFRTMGVPVLRGRPFDDRDDREHLRGSGREREWAAGINAIVIDEEFARRHFPGEDPMGRRVRLPWGPPAEMPVATVVGVVGRVREEKLADGAGKVQGYFCCFQIISGGMAVVVKTTLDPNAVTGGVRRAVASVDPGQPVFDVRTLDEMRRRSLNGDRMNLALLCAFAAVALTLAVVGLYGVLAYTVAQQRREIGVRMALGARRGQVVALFVGEGMRLTAAGAAIGLGCALASTRLLQRFLYDVSPMDPLTLASAIAGIGAVALVASLVPAARAAGVEPLAALRHE
jgi:putative ABC transport system permease protein